MSTTIIFGTKRLGQTVAQATTEKYPDIAVITVEGVKGAKKSRRILMNTKAAELLNAEVGSIQELVFASVEMGEDKPNQVLIANAATIDNEVDVTYKTSKNKVAYGEDSSEKGKAVTSSHACSEIFRFLGLDDSSNVEFQLNPFPSDDLEAFSLDAVGSVIPVVNEDAAPAITSDEVADTPVLETNSGELTGAELQDSVQAEVARAEEANPVLQSDEDTNEVASKTPVEEVLETTDNDWM